MERAGRFMDAITLHYYTVPGTWQHKGSATEFDQAEYEQTLRKCLRMDEIITCHEQIMNRHDHKGRV